MQYKKVQKSSWNEPYSSSSFTVLLLVSGFLTHSAVCRCAAGVRRAAVPLLASTVRVLAGRLRPARLGRRPGVRRRPRGPADRLSAAVVPLRRRRRHRIRPDHRRSPATPRTPDLQNVVRQNISRYNRLTTDVRCDTIRYEMHAILTCARSRHESA